MKTKETKEAQVKKTKKTKRKVKIQEPVDISTFKYVVTYKPRHGKEKQNGFNDLKLARARGLVMRRSTLNTFISLTNRKGILLPL